MTKILQAPSIRWGLIATVALTLLAGCSIRRYAINQIGNAIASGGSTYEQDDDIELVGSALPFGLKLIESLLEQSPKHAGLLLAASSGFTQYAYVYVDQSADEAMDNNLERAAVLQNRARRLYARARGYGLRALDRRYPGMALELEKEPRAALARTQRRDVPALYWTAAAYGLAISTSRNDPEMIAQIPIVEALIGRAIELDEGWGEGALHEFLVSFDGARPLASQKVVEGRLRREFDRALTLSGGKRASLFVAYAESRSVRFQQRAEFQQLLQRALAVDLNANPPLRLANAVSQRRARWLLGRTDELFLAEGDAAGPTPAVVPTVVNLK